jgi:hypothetical protein
MKSLVLLSVAALSLAACGSSDGGQAATATKGDSFCKLAQTAADDNDALDALDFTDADKVKINLSAALDSLTAAAAKAPKDVAADVKDLLTMEEAIETQLKKNNYDIAKTDATTDGKAAIEALSKSPIPDSFDKYLSDKCGIIRPTDDSTPDSTPTDDTTATGDTIATDDTSTDISIELGDGDDAINKFLDFFELGTGTKLTDDQRSCIVSALSGKVTGDDLNKAISGQASDALSLAVGQAFLSCNVNPTQS